MAGFGIAVIEANLLGIPAIGARDTRIQQSVSHRVSGMLVHAHNENEIAEAVEEIVTNSSFSHQAITWAKGHDWNLMVKKYLTLLN